MSEQPLAASSPNWRCDNCGYEMWAEFKGTVEFSVVVGCPGCGAVMDRLSAARGDR